MADFRTTDRLLTLEEALVQIQDALSKQDSYERLPLKKALHRVVYQDIISTVDVPGFRNSSMDGYALRFSDLAQSSLNVIATSWAGKPYTGFVGQGECVRIFTGAYVPVDCDCVVMQENISQCEDTINVKHWPKHEENIRNMGDDTKRGQTLFAKGKALGPADIGLLASCGIADIAVFKSLTVGFFSTGDELASIGSALKLGQIYDSNRYTLHALLEETGVTAIDMGVIPDNAKAVEVALHSASKQCDVIITTGGVSVGGADFITNVLDKIGNVNLWKIAIKPGKPLLFGCINNTHFFGLPGNPVSVMVTFQQVVSPALKKLMGHSTTQAGLILQATTTETITKHPGRLEFQRGFAENIDGKIIVKPTGRQGSHILSSMSKANCFIVLEQNSGDIKKGQTVSIQLLGNSL